jgi:hypothetical protein
MHPECVGPNQMSSSLYAGLDVFEKFGLPILREVKRDALDAPTNAQTSQENVLRGRIINKRVHFI